ncbi:hypothetical protein [Thalassospira lucentensis]|uniref:Uncharacterized protein n=1 Tax=Thalassospira lucentensis TaxID=168935 RepID=A0A358HN03_9PROT|nr:hypothetical protein [Thalassospira lucentensis]HBU96551.1 hypothetical protein [Thalassospira lucentensis]HCW65873.1 hypothetical protein [Thalassospira lucentensis]
MYVFIFTTVVIGFAAAGVIMLLFRLLGRKVPKYVIPFTAAIAMFCYMIWDEYSWFDRYASRLPDTVIITQTFADENVFAPWTLITAPINRFTAVDRERVVINPHAPDEKRVTTLLLKKGSTTLALTHLVNCTTGKRGYITDQTSLDQSGFPTAIDEWFDLKPDDPLRAAVCG